MPDRFQQTLNTLKRLRAFSDALADGSQGPEMLWLPGGDIELGRVGHEMDEHPLHPVNLKRFAISRYPLTFAAYDYFVESQALNTLRTAEWWPHNLPRPERLPRRAVDFPSDHGWGRGQRPVIQVTWYEALAYAEWLSAQTGHSYRLPTEAEWEYAARAGSHGAYCFGDDEALLADYAWYIDNAAGSTWPIGLKQANAWGLYDMHGNVWEWTGSRYAAKYCGYEQHCVSGAYTKDMPISVRGGAWLNKATWLRSSLRYWYSPDYKSQYLGFRLVREI